MPRKNFPNRKKERHESAQERQQARSERSPQEQLALLDRRLGKGVGAAKERERLAKLIEKQGGGGEEKTAD